MDGQLSGQQVVTDNAGGSLSFRGVLLSGVRSLIDLEVAERTQLIGDAATVNDTGTATTPSDNIVNTQAAVDTIKALTPLQIGLLMIAAGLSFALVTGQFRPR
jgi:hypothetical protein